MSPPPGVEQARTIDATLAASLEQTASALAEFRQLDGSRYQSHEAMVLALGQPWIAQARPSACRQGRLKACYWNALTLVLKRPDLDYVEGYALPVIDGWVGLPVHHAWAVDQAGRVWDPTWPEPEHSAYYGIVFSRDEITRFRRAIRPRNEFAIIELEYLIGAPLLRHGRLFPSPERSTSCTT